MAIKLLVNSSPLRDLIVMRFVFIIVVKIMMKREKLHSFNQLLIF